MTKKKPGSSDFSVIHARGNKGGLCGAGDRSHPVTVTAAGNNVNGVSCQDCLKLLSPVEFVCGFAFDTRNRVALIRKNRPEWQAGRLNGVGGHVEPGEEPDIAMVREFHEETGTRLEGWRKYAVIDYPRNRVNYYVLRDLHPIRLDGLRSATDEEVCVINYDLVRDEKIVSDMSWLLPLAAYTADTYQPVYVAAAISKSVDKNKP